MQTRAQTREDTHDDGELELSQILQERSKLPTDAANGGGSIVFRSYVFGLADGSRPCSAEDLAGPSCYTKREMRGKGKGRKPGEGGGVLLACVRV